MSDPTKPTHFTLHGSEFYRINQSMFICMDIKPPTRKRILEKKHDCDLFGCGISENEDGEYAAFDTIKVRHFLKKFRVLTQVRRNGDFSDLKPIYKLLNELDTYPIVHRDRIPEYHQL